jgi:hypothetical protein
MLSLYFQRNKPKIRVPTTMRKILLKSNLNEVWMNDNVNRVHLAQEGIVAVSSEHGNNAAGPRRQGNWCHYNSSCVSWNYGSVYFNPQDVGSMFLREVDMCLPDNTTSSALRKSQIINKKKRNGLCHFERQLCASHLKFPQGYTF